MLETSDRVFRFARYLVPPAVCLTIALASVLPVGGGDTYGAVGPMLVFSVVFAWVLARPEDIPPWTVFIIGVVVDSLYGGPLGLWTLCYLVGYLMACSQRESLSFAPRVFVWVVYTVISGFVALIAWGVGAAYLGTFVDAYPLLLGCAISVAAFALISGIGGSRADGGFRRFERV